MDFKGAFLGAALLSTAGQATAEELLNPDIIDSLLANQDALVEMIPVAHDPLYDLVDGLLEDGNVEMGFTQGPKFAETTRHYSEDGFITVSSERFPEIQQFDLSAMYQMCRDFPEQCTEPDDRFSVFIANSPEVLKILREVNDEVNQTHIQMNDIDRYGVSDLWAKSDGLGADCEDLVLAKKEMLIARGIPEGAIRMLSVITPQGEGHEVLGVSTFNGTVILDNVNTAIGMLANSEYEVVAATTPQEPWKKAPSLSMSFNDAFVESLEQQELAYYAPIDDSVSIEPQEDMAKAIEPVKVAPIPFARPEGR